MSGTVQGGKAAAITNKAKDIDFYRKIGRVGGLKGRTGGFYAATPEQRIAAGRKGGTISRRGQPKAGSLSSPYAGPDSLSPTRAPEGSPSIMSNVFKLFRRTK